MTTPDTAPRAKWLFPTGMLCLAIAIGAPRFVTPATIAGADAWDGVRGLLFGVAIGTLLLSVWRTGRQRRGGRSPQ